MLLQSVAGSQTSCSTKLLARYWASNTAVLLTSRSQSITGCLAGEILSWPMLFTENPTIWP